MRAFLFAVMVSLAAAATSGDDKDVQSNAGNFDKYMSKYAGDYEKYMHGSGQAPQGSAGNYQKYMSKYAADYQQYMPQHDSGASQAGPGNSQYVSEYADKYRQYMKLSQDDGRASGDDKPVTLMAEAQHPHSKIVDRPRAKESKDSNAKDVALRSNSESRGQAGQDSQGSAGTYKKYMSQYASDYKAYMPKDASNYHKYISQYAGDYQKYMSQYSGKALDAISSENKEHQRGEGSNSKAQEGVKAMLLIAEGGGHSESKTEAEKQRHGEQLPLESRQQPTERETEKRMEHAERNAEQERLAKELSSERAELEAEMKREKAEREAEKEHLRKELMQEERQHAQQQKKQGLETSMLRGQEPPSVLTEASPSHPILAVATLAGLAAVALLTTAFHSLNLGTQSSQTEYVQPPPAEV